MLRDKLIITFGIAAIIIMAGTFYPILMVARAGSLDLWFNCTIINCTDHERCDFGHCLYFISVAANLSDSIYAEEAIICPVGACCASYLNKTLPCVVTSKASVEIWDSVFSEQSKLSQWMYTLLGAFCLLILIALVIIVKAAIRLRKAPAKF